MVKNNTSFESNEDASEDQAAEQVQSEAVYRSNLNGYVKLGTDEGTDTEGFPKEPKYLVEPVDYVEYTYYAVGNRMKCGIESIRQVLCLGIRYMERIWIQVPHMGKQMYNKIVRMLH